jgi:hypothetical protein
MSTMKDLVGHTVSDVQVTHGCTIVVRNSSNGYYGGSLARGTAAGEGRSIVGKDDWTAYEVAK